MVQDLVQDWIKYAAHIVQYLNKHLFKRQLKAASFIQRKEEHLNEISERDEEISSGEDVEQCFDKVEFMNKFHSRLMQIMNEGIMQLMNQLANEPSRKQHRKLLCKEKAVPPPKAACKAACKCTLTHTMWPDCGICPHGAMKH